MNRRNRACTNKQPHRRRNGEYGNEGRSSAKRDIESVLLKVKRVTDPCRMVPP